MRDRSSIPTILLVRSSAIIFAYRSPPLSSHPGDASHRTLLPIRVNLEPALESEEPHVYRSAEPVMLYIIKLHFQGRREVREDRSMHRLS